MSLIDRRLDTDDKKQAADAQPLKIPGLITEMSPIKQLDFSDPPAQLSSKHQIPQLDFPSQAYADQPAAEPVTGAVQSVSGPLMIPNTPQPDLVLPPAVTRQLAHTGALIPVGRNETTTARQPVVIRGSKQKSTGMLPPPRPKKSHALVHLAVASLLVFIVMGTLLVVAPIGHGQSGFALFNSHSNVVKTSGNNSSVISQEAATATAVMQDGHDVGINSGQYAFIPSAPTGANTGSLGRFFYGQCTYWANMRYHQLSGNWVNWLGDAWAWRSGAMSSGWNVSSQPHVPSIVVLQPYVEGAGGYGHVAVVEGVNSDGSVTTTNWNWGGSGAGTVDVRFTPAAGVSFIWR